LLTVFGTDAVVVVVGTAELVQAADTSVRVITTIATTTSLRTIGIMTPTVSVGVAHDAR
jgi:hypothetical protein